MEVTIPEAIDILRERKTWDIDICTASRKITVPLDHKCRNSLKIDISFIDNIDTAVNKLKELSSLTVNVNYCAYDFSYVVRDIKTETLIKFLEDIWKEKNYG